MVKGRNEPAAIAHVAHVIAKLKGITVEEVCEAYVTVYPYHVLWSNQGANALYPRAWNNSIRMFGLGESV